MHAFKCASAIFSYHVHITKLLISLRLLLRSENCFYDHIANTLTYSFISCSRVNWWNLSNISAANTRLYEKLNNHKYSLWKINIYSMWIKQIIRKPKVFCNMYVNSVLNCTSNLSEISSLVKRSQNVKIADTH